MTPLWTTSQNLFGRPLSRCISLIATMLVGPSAEAKAGVLNLKMAETAAPVTTR
jgi:hypothetical protein